MISKIESLYHWFSISCMAGAVGMVCAGYTVLQPVLYSGGELVTLLYWSLCAAFVVATAGFAYLALLSAQQHLCTVAAGASQTSPVVSSARSSSVKQELVDA